MKKRLLTIVLSLAMLATLCSAMSFSVSAAGNNPYICVPKTDAKITIDGEKGSDYDKAVEIPLDRIIIMSEGANIPGGTASIMWGADQKLYAYIDVKDTDKGLYNSLKDIEPDAGNTDCVEFYAYWGNGEPVCMYRITRDGVLFCQQNAHTGTAKLIDEQGDASSHFEAAVKETENGYAAEFKINTYLANLCEGALISFKIVISSTDDVRSYTCCTSNEGCQWSATRYYGKLASTVPQNYANMMLVGTDGADNKWHKFPSLSPDDIDSNRFNADKKTQALSIREATFINDYECIVKFSKPCTLQWFNNAPVFIGACSGPRPQPEAITVYEDGKQWQIGFDLSSAVTNDGGTTWKLKLDKPLLKYADGNYAPGVVRISETQGYDISYYQTDDEFIGHIISTDGKDYINANVPATNDVQWDVAYVNYTVNPKLTWDASKETPLPATSIEIKIGEEVNDPRLSASPFDEQDEPGEGDDGDDEGDGDDDNGDADFNGGKKKNKDDDKGGIGDYLIWIIIGGVVVVGGVVAGIVLGGKKKKK